MRFWTLLLSFCFLTSTAFADPLILIMIGPPGAGKGTQAKQLAKHYNIPHISTGAMLRDHIARKTDAGKQAQAFVSKGELVPNEVIVRMLTQTLSEQKSGFILDGFPRSVDQAKILKGILHQQGRALSAVMQLEVPDAVVMERLQSRGRKDDTPEVIKRRLQVFHKTTAPVVGYYSKEGLLRTVAGQGTVEQVQQRLRDRIDAATLTWFR